MSARAVSLQIAPVWAQADIARALIARTNLSRAMLNLEIAILRIELLSLHGPQADLPGNGLLDNGN